MREGDDMNGSTRPSLSLRLAEVWTELGGAPAMADQAQVMPDGSLPSVFATTDLAAVSVGCAGLALSAWITALGGTTPAVEVSRRLASFWFGLSFKPVGWEPPPLWDALAGDYPGRDGWIRLHTNAAHHRAAALSVLGAHHQSRESLSQAVAQWDVEALETAVVEAGGCAAAMRSIDAWRMHPVGAAIAREPLALLEQAGKAGQSFDRATPVRPLAGIRVLDLTRILAGPIATRFLAGYGADVLRIDPPGWEEGVTIPDVALGKRCARLDLASEAGRNRFLELLADADVLVHGYRSDALERLGLGEAVRRAHAPGIVDVALDAYGWQTPWAARRGFDSLVQMSCGIAEEGMRRLGTKAPKPLPVQALDHATGYLMAAAAIQGLTARLRDGVGSRARLSLARTAKLLIDWGAQDVEPALCAQDDSDFSITMEPTSWGHVRRLKPPLTVEGAPLWWANGARALGSDAPAWRPAQEFD